MRSKGRYLPGTVVALMSDQHGDCPMTVEHHSDDGVEVVWFNSGKELDRDIISDILLYEIDYQDGR